MEFTKQVVYPSILRLTSRLADDKNAGARQNAYLAMPSPNLPCSLTIGKVISDILHGRILCRIAIQQN